MCSLLALVLMCTTRLDERIVCGRTRVDGAGGDGVTSNIGCGRITVFHLTWDSRYVIPIGNLTPTETRVRSVFAELALIKWA